MGKSIASCSSWDSGGTVGASTIDAWSDCGWVGWVSLNPMVHTVDQVIMSEVRLGFSDINHPVWQR